MAIDGQILEDAGEAFYRALRLFGGANDYGHSSTRTYVVETFKTVAFGIAQARGALSTDQVSTINSMFYLDLDGLREIAAKMVGDAALVDHAADQLVELVHDTVAAGKDAAPIIDAADKLFGAALTIGDAGHTGAARLAAVMGKLRAAAPSTAEAAAPVDPQPTDVAAFTGTTAAVDLAPVACSARLRDGETCYATTSAVLYQESSRVSHVRYGGFSGNIRIARGISYRSGSYEVDQTRTPKIDELASGELSITDQRLIFLSEVKNLDLPFARLLSCSTEPGLIAVARANAGYLIFDQVDARAVEVFEQVTGTSAEGRQAIEQQQDADYQASLGNEGEPASHFWRNAALVVALVVVLIILQRTVFG